MKLISVERALEIYNRSNNVLVSEIPLNLSVELLKTVVAHKEDDEMLYLTYELNTHEFYKLIDLIKEPIEPDFNLYYYILECRGIYDWSK